jgi:hypothetical protein
MRDVLHGLVVYIICIYIHTIAVIGIFIKCSAHSGHTVLYAHRLNLKGLGTVTNVLVRAGRKSNRRGGTRRATYRKMTQPFTYRHLVHKLSALLGPVFNTCRQHA